jgi:hypothetical protein
MKRIRTKTLHLSKESLLLLSRGQASAAVAYTAFETCSLRFCPTGEVVCPHEG